jgi:hypothetical protein
VLGRSLFIQSRETVWKIRMGLTLGSHERVKRGEKPPYCRFCATKNTRSKPLQLFSKQFQKGNSRQFIYSRLHKSRPVEVDMATLRRLGTKRLPQDVVEVDKVLLARKPGHIDR